LAAIFCGSTVATRITGTGHKAERYDFPGVHLFLLTPRKPAPTGSRFARLLQNGDAGWTQKLIGSLFSFLSS